MEAYTLFHAEVTLQPTCNEKIESVKEQVEQHLSLFPALTLGEVDISGNQFLSQNTITVVLNSDHDYHGELKTHLSFKLSDVRQ
mmetsp:Transcript_34476/g.39062  ORF Transcript_34476/g.39062 Transcript_34476/m.39062 type:complete len:84 (-) Transcript_34476:13-264(-)